MEDDVPVIYGLEFQARCLAAQISETEFIRFIVGTQSLRCDNQIHLIDFDDESNIIHKTEFLHKAGEIWHLSSCPFDSKITSTIYNKTSSGKCDAAASLWRFPDDGTSSASLAEGDNSTTPEMELLLDFEHDGCGDPKSVLWQPAGEDNKVVTITDTHIVAWDLAMERMALKTNIKHELTGKSHPRFTTGRWNPHHTCSQVATANDTHVRGWDLRSMEQVYVIENAHGQLVRDLDFNPNKQYYLATCGDDCKTKFWDVRDVSKPLKVLADHSHWVWCVRYNNFHDQLVLTSSSDSRVILNNAASISSEPFGALAEEDEEDAEEAREPLADGVISAYEEHEDSVYVCEWSSADPWLFASLSFDGRVVINRVPRATKYRILL